jgi:hypothetical protein
MKCVRVTSSLESYWYFQHISGIHAPLGNWNVHNFTSVELSAWGVLYPGSCNRWTSIVSISNAVKINVSPHGWNASRSEAWTVFARSNARIVGSNPTQSSDVCVRLFCVCVVLCALRRADPPSKESYRLCINEEIEKAAKVQQNVCSAVDRQTDRQIDG